MSATPKKIMNVPLEKLLQEHKVDIVSKISGGNFGEVYKVKHNGKFKACKLMLCNSDDTKWASKNELNAKNVLKNHPNVCITELYAETPSRSFIIMPLCDGSLGNYFKGTSNKWSDKEKSEIISGLINGLIYIHLMNLIHGDIKPDNILMDKVIPKYADFGLCQVVESDEQEVKSERGSDRYRAYETEMDGIICKKSDVCSLGLTFFELLQNEPYFSAADKEHLSEKITWTNAFKRIEDIKNEKFKILLAGMIKKRQHRYSAQECHDVFEDKPPAVDQSEESAFVKPRRVSCRVNKKPLMETILNPVMTHKMVDLRKLNGYSLKQMFVEMAIRTEQDKMTKVFQEVRNRFIVHTKRYKGEPIINIEDYTENHTVEYKAIAYVAPNTTAAEFFKVFWEAYVEYVALTGTIRGKTSKQLRREMKEFVKLHN